MLFGLLAALAAAAAFGTASVLQTIGGRRTVADQPLGAGLVAALMAQPLFALGVLLDVAGFVLNLLALQRLPLFVVQPTVGASVAVTALLASRYLGESLSRAQRVALLGTLAGLGLLAASADAGPAEGGGTTGLVLLVGGVPLLAAAAFAVDRRGGSSLGLRLAVVSGVAFAAFGLAGRTLVVPDSPLGPLAAPGMWAAVAFAVGGLALFGAALARSTATAVTSVSMVVESLLGSAAGLMFWDHLRPGRAPVMLSGLFLCLACAPKLAGSGQDDRVRPVYSGQGLSP